METKYTGGMLWALDDAWSMDPPPIQDGDDANAQTLWADDARAWDEEPQTAPDVADAVELPGSTSPP